MRCQLARKNHHPPKSGWQKAQMGNNRQIKNMANYIKIIYLKLPFVKIILQTLACTKCYIHWINTYQKKQIVLCFFVYHKCVKKSCACHFCGVRILKNYYAGCTNYGQFCDICRFYRWLRCRWWLGLLLIKLINIQKLINFYKKSEKIPQHSHNVLDYTKFLPKYLVKNEKITKKIFRPFCQFPKKPKRIKNL